MYNDQKLDIPVFTSFPLTNLILAVGDGMAPPHLVSLENWKFNWSHIRYITLCYIALLLIILNTYYSLNS